MVGFAKAQGPATAQVGAMSKRRRLNETHPDNDFYDGLDPQIPQRNFVEFSDGLRDHSDRDDEAIEARDDEVNARERDAELLDALQANMRNALTEEERLVVDLRIQMRATYAAVAARVGLSGPSQARKIEQRALQKMRKRLSRFHKDSKDLRPKLDKSSI
jgi:RNA polymerase sigma factor (sigma-70 family)